MIALAIDTIRLTGYLQGGASLPSDLVAALIMMVPTSLVGARLAKAFVEHVSPWAFRYVVAVFLLLVGTKLALFP